MAIQTVLIEIWTAAWAAGSEAADGENDEQAMHSLLNQLASQWIAQIVGTTLKLLAKALAAGGATVQILKNILQDADRAHDIALTEITRVMAEAAQKVYRDHGVIYVRWITEPGACVACIANRDAGRWPLGVPFPSGATAPPQHVRCRCGLVPA